MFNYSQPLSAQAKKPKQPRLTTFELLKLFQKLNNDLILSKSKYSGTLIFVSTVERQIMLPLSSCSKTLAPVNLSSKEV
jgi:hypothetical protein